MLCLGGPKFIDGAEYGSGCVCVCGGGGGLSRTAWWW